MSTRPIAGLVYLYEIEIARQLVDLKESSSRVRERVRSVMVVVRRT
jgi:hypothetical protein